MASNVASPPVPVGLSRLLRNSDVLLAVGVVAILAMMVIPLPDTALDMLLIINIASALTILLVSMYTREPLQFSAFPSVLLLATLFRLGLNVSASKLILLHGYAGRVIESFGSFVVGGNYVVGIVAFLILVVIQFVVITNGAGRVAEVAARFTLDAMPGKQMSIDADLNAGLITEEEARRRRRAIEMEADFYGAMDGASKFVKGDAIAGVVIILVNIMGGFAIGVLQRGLSLGQALATYTLLTIGDGLVTQIPALLISTATGIIVTRAASESNLGRDIAHQVASNPRALAIVAVLLLLFGLVPGLPSLPFFAIAGLVGAVAYLSRTLHPTSPTPSGESEGYRRAAGDQATGQAAVENVLPLLRVDPMELAVGYGLIALADISQGGTLLNRVTLIRRQTALELGIILPTIRIRDDLSLRPNVYSIRLRGVEIARGELMPNHYLAMNAGAAQGEVQGIPTREPTFGLPAMWVSGAQKEAAEMLGYTVVDATSVLATHLTEVIKAHAPSILGRQDVQTLLNNLKAEYPAVVEELVPGLMSVGEVQRVLQGLLRERVSIRDLVTILEALATHARTTKDPELLVEYVRQALGRSICAQYVGQDGVLRAITLSPSFEQALASALQPTEQGTMVALEPGVARRAIEKLAGEMEKLSTRDHSPVVLCSSRVRGPFRRLVERSLPSLAVLSYAEIPAGLAVESVGVLEV